MIEGTREIEVRAAGSHRTTLHAEDWPDCQTWDEAARAYRDSCEPGEVVEGWAVEVELL